MNLSKYFILLTFTLLLSGCFSTPDSGLQVVGIDDFGNEVIEYIDTKDFQEDLDEVYETVSTQATKVTDRASFKSDYELETIIVGLGIDVGFRIQHITSMNSSGRFRFVFSKNSTPIIPE